MLLTEDDVGCCMPPAEILEFGSTLCENDEAVKVASKLANFP